MIRQLPADVSVVAMHLRGEVETTAGICGGFCCTMSSVSFTATTPGRRCMVWYACTSRSGVLKADKSCFGGSVPYDEMVEAAPPCKKRLVPVAHCCMEGLKLSCISCRAVV